MLGFWATVGGVELEHEGDEMRKEKCTKTNIGSWKGEEKIKCWLIDCWGKNNFGESGWKSGNKWKVYVKNKKLW